MKLARRLMNYWFTNELAEQFKSTREKDLLGLLAKMFG